MKHKSHAISYSILAYWTTYFKAKHPAEFTEVMLNNHTGEHEEIALGLTMGRKLLDNPVVSLGDINTFSKEFSVTGDSITVGLKNIKGLGDSVLNKIQKGKPSPGGWIDFTEFYRDNLELKMIPHNGLKVLIQLGLFDGLQFCGREHSRKALCEIMDVYNTFAEQTKKNFKTLMIKLFDNEELQFNDLISGKYLPTLLDAFKIPTDEYTEKELIDFELEYVGFRVSENVERLKMMTDLVNHLEFQHISEYDEEEENSPHFWTKISTVEKLKTKKGKPYANVRAEDGSSFRVWHNKLQYCEDELIPGKIVVVKLTSDNFGRSLAWDRNSLLTEDNLLKLQQELY